MEKTKDRPRAHRSGGKVLSFDQKSDFFYKRGLDKLDKNDLVEALSSYRKALEKEPESMEIRLAIAEVLTEMERFEESNRILIPMLRDKDVDPECFFGMGCNFAGMNELERARESLEQYSQMDPEGEFIYDAYDMLDALDDVLYQDGDYGELTAISKEDSAFEAAEQGRELLEQENYPAAMEALSRALKLDPALHYARNNLSLAHFCKREYKKAIQEANEVLRQEPDNVQALCNLAMVQHTVKDKAAANKTADLLVKCDTDAAEELSRVTLVLMDLSRYEQAFATAEKLVRIMPYDEGALHRYGVCAYETGRYPQAVSAYDKLCRISPDDTIARFYRKLSRTAQLHGAAHHSSRARFMFNYQVPFEEMVSRINRINELVTLPREELVRLWSDSDELASLAKWGFTLPDNGIKRALLSVVGSFEDAKGEAILRAFILLRDQDDELKHHAFALLATQGAKAPYIAYMDGKLVESRVTAQSGEVSQPYKDALGICLLAMKGKREEETIRTAAAIWSSYVNGGFLPRISRPQATALAAAIEYLSCKRCGEKASRSEICSKYGVSPLRLKNALNKLTQEEQ